MVRQSRPGLPLPIQVLLVEDDIDAATYTIPQVRRNQEDMLKVEWKDTVLSAISRLAEPGIDVILLDLGMPGWGGYETHLAIISVVHTTVPVVILTGDESTATHDKTKLQGAANYLIKHRTSTFKLKQALYEAVVPTKNPKARFRWWISDL
jgi:DNA-binding NarL/FixJ family response regulator